jgi:hypothetical protein
MDIRIGDVVKFRDGLYEDEKETVYVVREVNGDRSILELIYPSMIIRPESVALLCDLEILEK